MTNHPKRLLHVGCGQKTKLDLPSIFHGEDWQETRYDINPDCAPDIVGDITDLKGIEDGAFDAVVSSHNIEHLFAHEVPVALGEFKRVLRPGTGLAIITCPDLQAIGKQIADGKMLDPLYTSSAGPVAPIDILYGFRPSIARGNHFMAHKTGFTARSLAEAIAKAGFDKTVVKRSNPPPSLQGFGFRWSPPEDETRQLCDRYALE